MVSVAGVGLSGVKIPRATTIRVGGAFRIPAPRRAKDAAPPTETAAADLAGMLALQEFEDERPRDRAARKYGQAVLGALSALQCALLTAGSNPDVLDRLVRLLDSAPEPDDPHLRSLLQSLLLRAHVELAKHGR